MQASRRKYRSYLFLGMFVIFSLAWAPFAMADVLPVYNGSISGTVTNAQGEPLSGHVVEVVDSVSPSKIIARGVTDARGHYQVSGLKTGHYKVKFPQHKLITGDYYIEQWYAGQAQAKNAALVYVLNGQNTANINAQMIKTGSISGMVTDGDGKPLPGILVVVSDERGFQHYRSYTDQAGRYYVGGVQEGSYIVGFNTIQDQTRLYLMEYYHNQYDRFSLDKEKILVHNEQTTQNINAQLEQGGSISGTVTYATGKPAAGIQVRVDGSYMLYTYTDANGNYTLNNVPPGTHRVLFHGRGHIRPSQYLDEWYNNQFSALEAELVTVYEGKTTSGIDAQIDVGGSVSGRVTDQYGRPISGVSVYINLASPEHVQSYDNATTDSNGEYLFVGLPAGQYKVSFASGSKNIDDGTNLNSNYHYFGEWYNDQGGEVQSDLITVELGRKTEHVDAELALGGAVSGRVTDTQGQPLSGIEVALTQSDTPSGYHVVRTDSDGRYQINGFLRAGKYKVKFTPGSNSKYLAEWYGDAADVQFAQSIDIRLGETTLDIDTQLDLGGAITGRVLDETGNPIVNASVNLYGANDRKRILKSTVTDAEGNYRFLPVHSGEYRLYFDPSNAAIRGYYGQWYNSRDGFDQADLISVSDGQTTELSTDLVMGERINGKVTGANGEPLSNLWVKAYDVDNGRWAGSGSSTDSQGQYSITKLQPGNYKVFADVYSYQRHYIPQWYGETMDLANAKIISIADRETVSGIDIQLEPTGTVSGRVTDEAGNPLPNVSLLLSSTSTSFSVYASTDQNGEYRVQGLTPGDYRILFQPRSNNGRKEFIDQWYLGGDSKETATKISVAPSQVVVNQDTQLKPAGSITGVVTNQSGEPLSGTIVLAYDQAGQRVLGTAADAEGKYLLSGLPQGSYRLYFDNSPIAKTRYIPQWLGGSSTLAEAQAVQVREGQETSGIDDVLAVPIPRIRHTPITVADSGQDVVITASVTDDQLVQQVTLFYRELGSGQYESLVMNEHESGTYVGRINAELVQAPGIEYYIEATDGEVYVQSGTPDRPHGVVTSTDLKLAADSPVEGTDLGGTLLTVESPKVQAGTSVFFNELRAQVLELEPGSHLTVASPVHDPGQVNIILVFPDGEKQALPQRYTYKDLTPPVVGGVEDGKSYSHSVRPVFTEGKATLNGYEIPSGKEIDFDGTYKLVVADVQGNKTEVNFVIDKIAPYILDVVNNKVYNRAVRPGIPEGSATLNGQPFSPGTEITAEGSYELIVTDRAGNQAKRNFAIDKTSPQVQGVKNGQSYQTVMIEYDPGSSATLNGKSLASGTTVAEEGRYLLTASDRAGNLIHIEFSIDRTPPSIQGVQAGQTYTDPVTPKFAETTATLNGKSFFSGGELRDDGDYVLVVTDSAGNKSQISFTIDRTGPEVFGVASGMVYNYPVKPMFDEGSATLNGSPFIAGTEVANEGLYELIVTDKVGNTTKEYFTIDNTAPVIEGVQNGQKYKHPVKPVFTGAQGILNGQDYMSGTEISTDGIYHLVVVDEARNRTEVYFVVDTVELQLQGVEHNKMYNHAVTPVFNEGKATLNDRPFASGLTINDDGIYYLEIVDAAGNVKQARFIIDTIAPQIDGVQSGKHYNEVVKPSFTEGSATLNGKPFRLGTEIKAEGSYELTLWDPAGNSTTVKFVIDRTAPVIKGVENGKAYRTTVKPVYDEGVATLNGRLFASGQEVQAAGNYTLLVTDQAGNKSTIKFSIDKTPPVIKGVANAKAYNRPVTPTFNEGKATLNGRPFTSGTTIKVAGDYRLIVTDVAGNVSTVTFKLDFLKPVVKGVQNGKTYRTAVKPIFNEGTATLNGKLFKSGTTIKQAGSYKLVVTDKAGNVTVINFYIK